MAGRLILKLGVITALAVSAWVPVMIYGSQIKETLPDYLISRAWQKTLVGEADARPWPWLVSMPVAQLTVPAFDRKMVVLHGVSGEVLAYAPGWDEGSEKPGSAGITLISGHQDRDFNFLHRMEQGQEILLTDTAGQEHRYMVQEMKIVQDPEIHVPFNESYGTLLLTTGFPVSNWQYKNDLTLVVVAVEKPLLTASDSSEVRSGA